MVLAQHENLRRQPSERVDFIVTLSPLLRIRSREALSKRSNYYQLRGALARAGDPYLRTGFWHAETTAAISADLKPARRSDGRRRGRGYELEPQSTE